MNNYWLLMLFLFLIVDYVTWHTTFKQTRSRQTVYYRRGPKVRLSSLPKTFLYMHVTTFISKWPWLMDLVKKICIRKSARNTTIVQNQKWVGLHITTITTVSYFCNVCSGTTIINQNSPIWVKSCERLIVCFMLVIRV